MNMITLSKCLDTVQDLLDTVAVGFDDARITYRQAAHTLQLPVVYRLSDVRIEFTQAFPKSSIVKLLNDAESLIDDVRAGVIDGIITPNRAYDLLERAWGKLDTAIARIDAMITKKK